MVELRSVYIRTKRRIRLEFSTALAAGAFAPSWFTLETLDGATGDPGVVAVLAVPGLTSQAELVLDRDLGPAGLYTLTVAAGLPAADASTLALTTQNLAAPNPQPAPSESLSAQDLIRILFQEDLAHDPVRGHLTAPDGDLATVTGPENASACARRGITSETLPHRNWGANLREYVDAPAGLASSLRGRIQRQAMLDDRVLRAKASLAEDENDGDVVFNCDLELIGKLKSNVKGSIRAGG